MGEETKTKKASEVILERIEETREEILAETKANVLEMGQRIDAFEAQLRERETVAGKPEEFSFCKLFRGMLTGNWKDAEHERHVTTVLGPKYRATTLSTDNDSYGGFIVPPSYLESEFIPVLYNEIALFKAGTRIIPVSGEPVIIPTQASSGTPYWVSENATITATDVTFGQKVAQPKHLAALVRMSNFVIGQSSPAVEGLVRSDIARVIGIELDLQGMTGTGSSGKPIGIQNVTGINTTSAGADITADTLNNMVYEIEKDKAAIGPIAAIMPYEQWNDLRQAADAAGTPKFYEGVGQIVKKEAWGFPVYMSHNLTDGDVVVGVWSEFIMTQWGGLEFAVSTDASDGTNHAFPMAQTWIRAMMSVDFVCRQPTAFCFDTSFT